MPSHPDRVRREYICKDCSKHLLDPNHELWHELTLASQRHMRSLTTLLCVPPPYEVDVIDVAPID